MSLFVQRQFASSLVGTFGMQEMITPTSRLRLMGPAHSACSNTSANQAPTTWRIELLDVTSQEWVLPVQEAKRQKTGLPRGPIHKECNHFVAVMHESFPACLYLWDEARRRLAELHPFTGPSLLEHYLPDPLLFVDPSNALKPALLLSWLRICPVILWQLGLPGPRLFVNKKWWAMLETADGFHAASQNHKEMLDILRSLVRESHSMGIQLDKNKISSAPAYWNGQLVQHNAYGLLDPQIVWEIVWELYEAKFCLEMLTID
ncbi:hypothetical protein BT96DRAFT_1002823 [Gymnopus androsaceus JB14]|uniref:Uncharacterized protein n=1 Tax=Gymnopus androsaceus JB14 TaxID=1447944 RepID=A0A6A4GX21_9AGAR|nr:hypothetical protein BT96DRAFT_1002823 [Gymnopus androsaceus JB14]